jgi:hypothetical protein
MKIFLLSPNDVPPNPHLFPQWIETWESKGHQIVNRINEAEVIMIDLHSRLSDYDNNDIDFVLQCKTPLISFDEFDKGGMSLLDWPDPLTDQQAKIFDHIYNDNIKAVHFCRLLNKKNKYPSNVFPYEKGILYEEELLTAEQLFDRPLDVCFVANHAPSREKIANALLQDGRLKCHISIGATKIPFNDFVNQHKRAKLFISSAAGGFGDERKQALFSVSGIISQRTDQLLLHDFTHLENCLKIDSPPTKKDIDTIYETVNDKERLYEIYKNGYRLYENILDC